MLVPGYECAGVCPWLERSELQGKVLRAISGDDIILVLKKIITANNYIYITIDETMILGKDCPPYHELFVYGFDEAEEIFFVADFTFRGKYSLEKVSYKEMKMAYESAASYTGGGLICWSVNLKAHYNFDSTLVYEGIKDYLDGKSYNLRYVKTYHQAPDTVSGILSYQFLVAHMYEPKNQMLKCLHNLYDHKKLMHERLYFMSEKNYINIENAIRYSEILKMADMAWKLYLKYEISGQRKLLDKEVTILNEMEQKERYILSKVVLQLEKTKRPLFF